MYNLEAQPSAGDHAGVLPGAGAGASAGGARGMPPGEAWKEGATLNSPKGAGETVHSHTWCEEDSALGWKKENMREMKTLSCFPYSFPFISFHFSHCARQSRRKEKGLEEIMREGPACLTLMSIDVCPSAR